MSTEGQPIPEKKPRRGKEYWDHLTEDQFAEELRRRGIDPANPPKIGETGGLWQTMRDVPRLKAIYLDLRTKAGHKDRKPPVKKGYWGTVSLEELRRNIRDRGFDPANLPDAKTLGDTKNADLLGGLSDRFGSLRAARVALGGEALIRDRGYWEKISMKDLIQEIIRAGLNPFDFPGPGYMGRHGKADLVGGIIKRCGSFKKARTMIQEEVSVEERKGFEQTPGWKQLKRGVKEKNKYWEEVSLDGIKEKVQEEGLDPTDLPIEDEFPESLRRGWQILKKRFGGADALREALGGTARHRPGPKESFWREASVEDIKGELIGMGLDPGNLPGANLDKRIVAGLSERFNGMANARVALGGKPLYAEGIDWTNISEGAFIDELKRRNIDPQNPPVGNDVGSLWQVMKDYPRVKYLYEELRRKAGHTIRKMGEKGLWESSSREELEKIIRDRGLDPANLPNSETLAKEYGDIAGGLRRRYGNINKARAALGGKLLRKPIGYWSSISLPDLIKEVRERGFDPVHLPGHSTLTESGNWDLVNGLYKRFGGIREARAAIREELAPGQFPDKDLDLEKNLEDTATEVSRGETAEAKEIQKLLGVFGNASCADVLYKFHPEYKSVAIGKVKSVIGDYLGEFLYRPRKFQIEDLDKTGIDFLEEPNFQEAFFDVLRRDCVSFCVGARRRGGELSPANAAMQYCAELKERTVRVTSSNLEAVIKRLETYCEELFALAKKPDNIVDALTADRPFPDFYQEVNAKEVSDKKRLLIADEMGGGKSASAILTKEYLRVPCALVVAPDNVLPTWRGYLSDEVSEEGKQIGYFKPNQAPRVLTIEEPKSLNRLSSEKFDYVVISQEKLNGRYTAALGLLDYQMLIVDEVHKLKNIRAGIRSKNLLELAAKIKGEDHYLALLSGTPVPNKVQDIAIVLKLLYPEEFVDIEDKELVRQIIYSDTLDLRAKLLARMEMKGLAENVEMPGLTERISETSLSEKEKEIYELLLEEDELEAGDKLRILRQFLMNPKLLDSTPGLESTKINEARRELSEAFGRCEKVVMFVNGYVEGTIRGEGNFIEDLKLPDDIEVLEIHGKVPKWQRERIQESLQESGKKILLLVSGQTADVGVDFSGAEQVYFYNEPWTMADKKQQLARVYRPGLRSELESATLLVRGTIEEGIHAYIQTKQRAIEKLIRGIPRTEIENKLLAEDEKTSAPNLEVNPELARYYFSDWDKMMRIFSYVKEIGEEDFKKFLTEFGPEYAQCYLNLGSRSYQANASRISATLVKQFSEEDGLQPDQMRILDLASGPEMLRRHISEPYQAEVISLDINREHFQHREAGGAPVVGSFLSTPIASDSIDIANFNFGIHYTQFIPSHGRFERLQTLVEMNRVLKVGGRGIINMIYSLDFKDEAKFRVILERLGFVVDEKHSGHIEVGEHYSSIVFTVRKVREVGESSAADVDKVAENVGSDNFDGLKFLASKRRVKDSRKIIDSFELNGQHYVIPLNGRDRSLLEEEKRVETDGKQLKEEFGGIEKIPANEIVKNGFTRILIKDKYVLFKSLENKAGVVVVR